jgi:hypothetical protein
MRRRGIAMVDRSSEPFRAFRIEEDEEGEGPKGRMVDIGLSDLNEGERVCSNIQTLTTPELMFRALLTRDGAQRLELARTWRSGTCTYAL